MFAQRVFLFYNARKVRLTLLYAVRKAAEHCTIVIRGENNMTIKDLKPGMSATVQTLLGHGALKRRMLDMGITRGTKVVMNKRAPFGDPLIINVRGYTLSLRGEDAESVSVAA